MNVNDRAARDRHVEKNTGPSLVDYEECYHYVSLGDFRIVQALFQCFAEEGRMIPVTIVHSSRESDDPLNPADPFKLDESTNIVVVGNRRVSWVVRELEDRLKPNFSIAGESSTRIEIAPRTKARRRNPITRMY